MPGADLVTLEQDVTREHFYPSADSKLAAALPFGDPEKKKHPKHYCAAPKYHDPLYIHI